MATLIVVKSKKKYKLRNFAWDVFMTCMTGGFWLIYIYVREKRN